jgi:hypothetical protein
VLEFNVDSLNVDSCVDQLEQAVRDLRDTVYDSCIYNYFYYPAFPFIYSC